MWYLKIQSRDKIRNQLDHNRKHSTPPTRRLSFHEKLQGTSESELLSKLPYDLSSHPPETTDWLNVLLAQAIIAYQSLVRGLDNDPTMPKGNKAKEMVEEAMNFARGETSGISSVDYILLEVAFLCCFYSICSSPLSNGWNEF